MNENVIAGIAVVVFLSAYTFFLWRLWLWDQRS